MQYSSSEKCHRCGATNPVITNFCLNCGTAFKSAPPENFFPTFPPPPPPPLIMPPPMIGFVVGKVIELNKLGFRLKTDHGNEIQVDANYEWKDIIKVGDEVNVKGGINENGIFLMAWMSVFRSGQWLSEEDFRKSRNWLKPWTWLKF